MIGLTGNGVLVTEGDFQSSADRKANMYKELDRLKRNWEEKNKIELPEIKTYEKKAYKEENADNIRAQAEEENSGALEAGKAEIENKNQTKRAKIESKIKSEEQNYEDDVNAISSEYAKSKENVVGRAIEQGIARSSIVDSEQDRLKKEEASALSARAKESEILNSAYQMELALLEKELESSLQNFEITQAVKVKKRINDLTSEIKRENEKILEYNNKMTELEQKSINARQNAIDKAKKEEEELQKEEARYGYSGYKKTNYEQRFDVAKNYYNTLKPKEALRQFESDSDMHDYLGLYYDDLHTYLRKRG